MRYKRCDLASTLSAAKKAAHDGRTRFVVATAGGFTICLQRVPFQNCYFTDGVSCKLWRAHESKPA